MRGDLMTWLVKQGHTCWAGLLFAVTSWCQDTVWNEDFLHLYHKTKYCPWILICFQLYSDVEGGKEEVRATVQKVTESFSEGFLIFCIFIIFWSKLSVLSPSLEGEQGRNGWEWHYAACWVIFKEREIVFPCQKFSFF